MTVQRPLCASWMICVLAVLITAALVSLGTWQMNRAEEKQTILEQQQTVSQLPVITNLAGVETPEDFRHRPVRLTGRFEGNRQFLLDNQIRNGRVGYSVLTPFLTEQGEWVLVDRGWVPQGLTRQLLPDVEIDSDSTVVSGTVYVPYAEPYALGAFDAGAIGWPLVIQYLDFESLATRLSVPLQEMTIRMSPENGPGYLREWAVVSMGPKNTSAMPFSGTPWRLFL